MRNPPQLYVTYVFWINLDFWKVKSECQIFRSHHNFVEDSVETSLFLNTLRKNNKGHGSAHRSYPGQHSWVLSWLFFFSFGMVFYNCFWVWLISYNSIATYLVFQYETQHKSWGKMFSEEELAIRIQKFTKHFRIVSEPLLICNRSLRSFTMEGTMLSYLKDTVLL